MSHDEITNANDMLEIMQSQRNYHANECVTLAAQLKAAARKIAELEAKIAATVKKPTNISGAIDSTANGHDSASALS